MAVKPKILWVTDGVGWGFDIRMKAVSKLLSNYEHIKFASREITHKMVLNEIKTKNPDIIMVMSPKFMSYLGDHSDKIILTLPSFRSIGRNV